MQWQRQTPLTLWSEAMAQLESPKLGVGGVRSVVVEDRDEEGCGGKGRG